MNNIFCDCCKKDIPSGEEWNCCCDCDYCKDCHEQCMIERDARKDSPFEFKQCVNCTKLLPINLLLNENQEVIKFLLYNFAIHRDGYEYEIPDFTDEKGWEQLFDIIKINNIKIFSNAQRNKKKKENKIYYIEKLTS